MSLGSVRIEHLDRRCPLRAEALERFRLFFDVDFDRQVVFVDEALDARVGVNLGIQPSTSPSHGSRTEVEQHVLVLSARLAKRLVYVFDPLHWHVYPPAGTL
jgi:hypothetical protein